MCLRINGKHGYNVPSLNVTLWDVARYKNTTHVISLGLQASGALAVACGMFLVSGKVTHFSVTPKQ